MASAPAPVRWAFPGWDNAIANLFTWDGRTPVQPDNPALGLPGIGRVEQKSYAVADLMVQYAINPKLTVSANL